MHILCQDNESLFYTNPMLFRLDLYGDTAFKTPKFDLCGR
jgi:hypothetical protein